MLDGMWHEATIFEVRVAVEAVLLSSLGALALWELSATVAAACDADPRIEDSWLWACEPELLSDSFGLAALPGPSGGPGPEEAAEGYCSGGGPGLPPCERCPSPPARGMPSSIAVGLVRARVQEWEARLGGAPPDSARPPEGGQAASCLPACLAEGGPAEEEGGEGEGPGGPWPPDPLARR